jgi:predicted GNAT superfamily acetyltransferase
MHSGRLSGPPHFPTSLGYFRPWSAENGGVERTPELVASAIGDAADSCRRAGVDIRALEQPGELSAVTKLFGEIWNAGGRELFDRDLLVAMAHAGNYVVGAYDDDRLVGACVGFFGEPLGTSLHSHIAGVVAGLDGRGIGTAMKHHQRAWCLQRGIVQITWTYDPLVARNAAFNLSRLRARIDDYLVEFYGPMNDGRNLGQPSDRVWVIWDLETRGGPVVDPALATSVLAPAADGSPHRTEAPAAVELVRVCVPSDIEALRRSDPETAVRWRYAVRDAMTELLGAGWVVAGFDRPTAGYLVQQSETAEERDA